MRDDIREGKNSVITKLDAVIGKLKAKREDEEIISHRVSNHEDRLEVVEDKLGIIPD